MARTAAGYHVCLDHLARVLDTGSAPSVADADTSTLEARYAEAVSAAASPSRLSRRRGSPSRRAPAG